MELQISQIRIRDEIESIGFDGFEKTLPKGVQIYQAEQSM
jgi:hypothetical protein